MDPAASAPLRRAALAALAPVLGEADSLQALAGLHARLRSDAASDVIAFVDAVAARQHLDDGQRRSLYARLHACLRSPVDSLPPDPWETLQALRGEPAAPAAASTAWPAGSTSASPTPRAAERPAAQQVFAALMDALRRGLDAAHADTQGTVQQACLAQFEQAHVSPLARETARAAWHHDGVHAWLVPGTPAELSELVHRSYLALCEVLGPDAADTQLTQAARQVEHSPAALACAPGELL